MIFVTVGTQLPFDRLIRAIDQWSARHPDQRVVAQTGRTSLTCSSIEAVPTVTPSEFDAYVQESKLIVAHAGIGSLFTAMRYSKPIVIMPRRASLGEHRNDHQLASAERFRGHAGVYVADDEAGIAALMTDLNCLQTPPGISPYASEQFLNNLNSFIDGQSGASLAEPNLSV